MPASPVVSWTPTEAWTFAELAQRALLVSLDGAPPLRIADLRRARVDIHGGDDAVTLVLHLDAERATITLAPDGAIPRGHRWRPAWALELTRPTGTDTGAHEAWTIDADPRTPAAEIVGARRAPLTAQLAARRRVLSRTLDGAAHPVAVRDVAFHRYTCQSTRVAEPPQPAHELPPWALPTEPAATSWWELDLGEARYLAAIHLDLDDVVAGSTIAITTFSYAAPGGGPPPGSQRDEHRAEGGATRVDLTSGRVGRYVRVDLTAPPGKRAALAVAACEVVAADLFADTLLETMRRGFALHHDRPLFLDDDGDGGYRPFLHYGEVWARASMLAGALARRLEPDPDARHDGRIFLGVVTRNRPEWVMADLAALQRGYVSVPLAPEDGEERMARTLALARPACLVCEAPDADRLAALAPWLRLLVVCDATAAASASWPATPPRIRLEDLLTETETGTGDIPPPEPRAEHDLYAILFTSGSSGTPRGAMRTYATFHAMLRTYGAGQPARHLSFQPLSHLSERMFLPALLVHGAQIAFSRGGAHLMDELRRFEPTVLGSVPRLFDVLHAGYQRRLAAAITAQPDVPRALHEEHALAEARVAFGGKLQSLSVGSAPVSREVYAFLHRCFRDIWVSEGYGSTEVGTIAVDGAIPAHVEVKLVPIDGADGAGSTPPTTAAPAPERGEIWVRTPHVIAGYLGDPAATAAAVDADGYFATGDLGERGVEGIVRVIGRLGNAVKLAQGEFVSSERVEGVLATASVVDRVYVHATPGAPALSALVLPDHEGLGRLLDDEHAPLSDLVARPDAAAALLAALRHHGRRAGLSAWELPRAVLLHAVAPTTANGLLTASGKLARAVFERRFGERLDELARGALAPPSDTTPSAGARADAPTDLLAARIAGVVARVVGRRIEPLEPLAGAGVDSLAAAEILAALGDDLGRDVPLALWFEAATIDDLAARLDGLAGATGASTVRALAGADLARAPAIPARLAAPRLPPRTVLVTGATGFLGAHLIEMLIAHTSLTAICLVRADDDDAAAARLDAALARHGIASPPPGRVRAIAADLAAPDLGLSDDARAALAVETDAILHAGAVVSWLAPYGAVRDANVAGTRALLELAAAGGRARPFHLVSTISTAPADGDEASMLELEAALASTPYALSKWIGEVHARGAASAGLPVTVYRPALIAGHSERGGGNPDDFLHRYLAAVGELGLHLDLENAVLDMTPVDFVARAIVAVLVAAPAGGGTYHLANVDQSMSYARLGRALAAAGVRTEPADYDRFRAALLAAPTSRLAALASFFPATGFTLGSGPWPCAASTARLAELGVRRPRIDDAFVARQLRASVGSGPE